MVIRENTQELFLGAEVGSKVSVVNITMFSLTLCLQFLKIYSSRKQSSLKILSENFIKQKHTLPVHCVFRYTGFSSVAR